MGMPEAELGWTAAIEARYQIDKIMVIFRMMPASIIFVKHRTIQLV